MTHETVIGIDPSLTGLAVCVWQQHSDDHSTMVRLSSKPLGATVALRWQRYRGMLKELPSVIPSGSLVVIEGYSSFTQGSAVFLGEFGGVLRNTLHCEMGLEVVEASPMSLKKFIAGIGNAKKDQIIAHVCKRWGPLFGTSDEADAYGLAQLGRQYAGWVQPENQAQRDVIEKLRNPPVKPKKSGKSKSQAEADALF